MDNIVNVIKYYNAVQNSYNKNWMNDQNLAMHLGFWDEHSKNLHDALINENKCVARELRVNNKDIVLDAGCGVGGTAIWIAENFGCKVTGISVVDKQVNLARKHAQRRNIDDLVSFETRSFAETGYPDQSFSKIYFVESISHAENKSGVLQEVYRLLKPNGICVITDAFVEKDPLTDTDNELLNDWYEGWACAYLANIDEFRQDARKKGFEELDFTNTTEKIMPSSKILLKHCQKHYTLKKLLRNLRLMSKEHFGNTQASISQYYLFRDDILGHFLLTLKKPA